MGSSSQTFVSKRVATCEKLYTKLVIIDSYLDTDYNFIFIKNAEKGGYAVGAFNVYNLEGIEAVVAAAEEEQSPAILQVSSLFK